MSKERGMSFRSKFYLGVLVTVLGASAVVGGEVSTKRLGCTGKIDWEKGYTLCYKDGSFIVFDESQNPIPVEGSEHNIKIVGDFLLIGSVKDRNCYVTVVKKGKVLQTTQNIKDPEDVYKEIDGYLDYKDYFDGFEIYEEFNSADGSNQVLGAVPVGYNRRTYCEMLADGRF